MQPKILHYFNNIKQGDEYVFRPVTSPGDRQNTPSCYMFLKHYKNVIACTKHVYIFSFALLIFFNGGGGGGGGGSMPPNRIS